MHFKLFLKNFRVGGKNAFIGKVGLAILENKNSNEKFPAYRLILYRTKEQILSSITLKLSTPIAFKSQYLQYADNFETFWSVMFHSDADKEEIIDQLKSKCQFQYTTDSVDSADPIEAAQEVIPKEAEQLVSKNGDVPNKVDEVENSEKLKEAEKVEENPIEKSAIVSRIAKLGHQLPSLSSTLTTNGERDDLSLSSDIQQSKTTIKPTIKQESNLLLATNASNVSVAYQTTPWPLTSDLQHLNNHLTESRIHNAEMRMNVSQLESKLDRVLDKIDLFRTANGTTAEEREDEILQLEEKIVELKKENRILKSELKIAVEKNQQEIVALQMNGDTEEKVNELTVKVDELQKEITEKNQAIKDYEQQIEKFKSNENNEKANTQSKLDALDEQKKQLVQLQMDLQEKNSNILELVKHNQEITAKNADKIRGIMNDFYGRLYEEVSNYETMTSTQILKLAAEIIRRETKGALNQ